MHIILGWFVAFRLIQIKFQSQFINYNENFNVNDNFAQYGIESNASCTPSNIDLMRPKELYNDVISQREADGKAFYKGYSSQFVDVNCPACGHQNHSVSFNKYGYQHFTCEKCETLYTNPRPTEELLNKFYSEFDAPKMWTKLLLEADLERKKLQYTPRIQYIINAIDSENCKIAIDLGAGSGAFASTLKDTGRFERIIALDISEDCVKACEKQNLESYCTTIDKIDSNSADVIFMNDIVEHLFDPKASLISCYNVLRKGGYLSVATPNCKGFDFQVLKENTGNITPPEHLNYFNPDSIKLMLQSIGFSQIEVKTPGILDVSIIEKSKEQGFDLHSKNQYIDFLLMQKKSTLELFQKFLQDSNLSSHMLIIAKK